jgi:hypothetical protein
MVLLRTVLRAVLPARPVAVLAVLTLLAACASLDDARTANRTKLINLAPGMTRAEVLRVMGTAPMRVHGSDTTDSINNPYRTEMRSAGSVQIEIIYYYTDIKQADNAITDDELTPLVLKDGVLDGWGWSYLDDVAAKYEIRLR